VYSVEIVERVECEEQQESLPTACLGLIKKWGAIARGAQFNKRCFLFKHSVVASLCKKGAEFCYNRRGRSTE